MIVATHPNGNANSAAVAKALYENDLLTAFYTCVVWRPESLVARFVPGSLRAILERRSRFSLPPELVHARPFREVMRTVFERAGKKHLIAAENSMFSMDGVYRDIDRYVTRSLDKYPNVRGVYAYDGFAVQQFRKSKKRGIHCFFDLPIGYWRTNKEVSAAEAELKPEWRGTLGSLGDSPEKCAQKDEEIMLADTILVASSFTRKTLEMYPGEKANVVVIPYGNPSPALGRREATDKANPLRVLYVGSLTQRKGMSYLCDAVSKLGSAAALTLIGMKSGESKARDRACETYRWLPSLPHTEVLAEMRRHDVLVFPSLFEGFGLVIGEALSQGLPVITTNHTGGPDILRDGIDSFIVPIRDSDAIAERLYRLHSDRHLLAQMSNSALQQAGNLSWQRYRDATVAVIRAAIARSQGES